MFSRTRDISLQSHREKINHSPVQAKDLVSHGIYKLSYTSTNRPCCLSASAYGLGGQLQFHFAIIHYLPRYLLALGATSCSEITMPVLRFMMKNVRGLDCGLGARP